MHGKRKYAINEMVYMNEIFTKSGQGMQNIVCLK